MYRILHIPTCEYLNISGMFLRDGLHFSYEIGPYAYIGFFIKKSDMKAIGITKKDYKVILNKELYFLDNVSAMSFLRDLYITTYNNEAKQLNKVIQKYTLKITPVSKTYKNEYDVVEVPDV